MQELLKRLQESREKDKKQFARMHKKLDIMGIRLERIKKENAEQIKALRG
jgi:homospermidine synthase